MLRLKSKKDARIKISYQLDHDGFNFFFDNSEKYSVKYPKKIWQDLGDKNVLAENFIYARTAPLGLATANQAEAFAISEPFLKKITDYGVRNDLPQIAFTNKLKLAGLMKNFQRRKITFNNTKVAKLVPQKKSGENTALLALSFGKDSLLTYGLMKELGFDYHLAYVNEMENSNSIENQHKRRIIKEFSANEKEKIEYLEDNADNIFYHKKLRVKIKNFDNSNGMLAFCLELLPFAYYHQAKYLILGNERNLNDHFNYQGVKAYPSFDQTVGYARKLNQDLSKFTGGNYQVVSLVEPIYNLAEFRILYHRYPRLLKYWMSCDLKMTLADRWCNNCPMCANAYLYSRAVSGDPAKIGMKHNLFDKKYQALYPLFNPKIKRAYEMPAEVREEQLLAFLLAYRLGAKGDLMNLFVSKYLNEAVKKEKKLRRKFFKVYPAVNVPPQYKTKLLNIFQGELKQFI